MLRAALEAQAPPKQNATDTINVLCGRLTSATLLEDRRSAIQGLRSFAKQYPASVASGSLRELISTLAKDSEDVDTGKLVLETLLMLFSPNQDSPEASEDISLWLADEFSQRQDNITTLLERLEGPDFYSRLYSLQLLSAISSARPERTQECILSAPLGITRLVSTLDDSREAIRTAALLLLNAVTEGSPEFQKVVAFESAFERIFQIIEADGGLKHGGIIVQDCLTLVANLIQINPSNQSLFREEGYVGRLARLLRNGMSEIPQDDGEDVIDFETRDKNIWGFLAVLRMFLVPGNLGTSANQTLFEKQGLLQIILDIGFADTIGLPIRAEALNTIADIIRGNSKIQERFAHNQVKSAPPSGVNGAKENGDHSTYIIDALLDLALSAPVVSLFDVRFAACECMQAYFYNHNLIRQHFLKRAIEGHISGDDETSNAITILIKGPRSYDAPDPYRIWFAAQLLFKLLDADTEAKKNAMAIVEGNADQGEETVTCIQAMTGNLVDAIRSVEDERISIAYLTLLCSWLFEDADAVNDFLSEGSTIKSLIQASFRNDKRKELVQGLCVLLLGICYEFSTKDSPIPRRTLQSLILSSLGREQYVSRLTRLREQPLVRDFEVLRQDLLSAEQPGGLPMVFLDKDFVNFLKDNYGRIMRSIDRDPNIEVARAHQGIDRSLVDSLQSQIDDRNDALQKAENARVSAENKLEQEISNARRAAEQFNSELSRIKNINDALQRGHEGEVRQIENEHRSTVQKFRDEQRKQLEDFERRHRQAQVEFVRQAENTTTQHQKEISELKGQIQARDVANKTSVESIESLRKLNNSLTQRLKDQETHIASIKEGKLEFENQIATQIVTIRNLENKINEHEGNASNLRNRAEEAENKLARAINEHDEKSMQTSKRYESASKDNEKRIREMDKKLKEAEGAAKENEEARASTQTELDDLMLVLADLEEKRTKDKAKLKELGQETSDDEDDDEDVEDGGEEEKDEDADETQSVD